VSWRCDRRQWVPVGAIDQGTLTCLMLSLNSLMKKKKEGRKKKKPRPGWAPDPLMVGIRSPIGQVVGSCTSHPGVLGSIPKREEPGKTGAPCVKVPGSSRVPARRPSYTCPPLSPSPHANSFVIGTAVINTHLTFSCNSKLHSPNFRVLGSSGTLTLQSPKSKRAGEGGGFYSCPNV